VLFFTIPSGVGFIVFKRAGNQDYFQIYKPVDEGAVSVAANVLMFFSIALLSQSIVTVTNRAFYAINDTLTPLLVGGSTIIINILLSMCFIK